MVARFNDFLADNEAGAEGADGGFDPMDEDNDSDAGDRGWDDPEDSDSTAETKTKNESKAKVSHEEEREGEEEENGTDDQEDAAADVEYAEYEHYYQKFMTLSAVEKAILTDEARALALEQDAEKEEDEEIRKLSEMMEAELFSHGALNINPQSDQKSISGVTLPGKDKGKGKAKLSEIESAEEDEEEDDGDDDLLDEDYNLADNMLKAFKGQVGMAGPAGNMMRAMGVQFPQDADDESKSGPSKH